MSQVLGVFGLWVSPCYGPFSPGACFETYEPFISLIFFRAADTESVNTVARLYFAIYIPILLFINTTGVSHLPTWSGVEAKRHLLIPSTRHLAIS
jgi:hypothetical protein